MLVTLALSSWVVGLLIALFLFICVVLVLTVLIQRPQGGGLSGAFGASAGSGQTAFGAKTGDALTIATIGMFVLYITAAVGLNYAVRPPEVVEVLPAATGTTDGVTTVPIGASPTTVTIPGSEGDNPQPMTPEPGTPTPAPVPVEVVPVTPPTEPTPAPVPAPTPAEPAPAPAEPAPGGGE